MSEPTQEPCDRVKVIMARGSNMRWFTERGEQELPAHLRIALDTEVEAGGPYLNNAWNRRTPPAAAPVEPQAVGFGEQSVVHEGVTLTCKNVVPGKSMHDIQQAFSAGVDEAEPGDEYAANPSKWPTMRGLRAVVTLVNQAHAAALASVPAPPGWQSIETAVERVADRATDLCRAISSVGVKLSVEQARQVMALLEAALASVPAPHEHPEVLGRKAPSLEPDRSQSKTPATTASVPAPLWVYPEGHEPGWLDCSGADHDR